MENNEKQNIKSKVFSIIEKECLCPEPKWKARLSDYSLWVVSILSIIVGGFSFSLFLTEWAENDFDLFERMSGGFWQNFFGTLPYIWFLFIFIFLFYSFYFLKNTERCYRFERYWIISGSVLSGLLAGIVLHFAGVGRLSEDFFVMSIPRYHEFTGNHAARWMNPENGFLTGEIISVGTSTFVVTDLAERQWIITTRPLFPGNNLVSTGTRVKLVGDIRRDGTFEVEELRPWPGKVESTICTPTAPTPGC